MLSWNYVEEAGLELTELLYLLRLKACTATLSQLMPIQRQFPACPWTSVRDGERLIRFEDVSVLAVSCGESLWMTAHGL